MHVLTPMVPSILKKAKEAKIPFVEINGDVVDPDYFDEEKAWRKLADFDKQIQGGFNVY